MLSGRLLFIVLASLPFMNSLARAERVGYQFTGTLNVPPPGPGGATPTWFGQPITHALDVAGTFSYDTTTVGVVGAPGERTFRQSISGGYSLDVDFGTSHVLVQASDYEVAVRNDYGSPATDQFIVDYQYFGQYHITPKRLLVNGAEWGGDMALLLLAMTWDSNTFSDPDEPKLTADRPGTANPGFLSVAGGNNPLPTIDHLHVTTITPQDGDYNRDGKIDANDYAEWQKTEGMTGQDLPADGNHDGIVDGADYIIWRKPTAVAVGLAAIPEPGGWTMFVTWIVIFVGSGKKWHRGARQR